jgi:hypothetical protein
MKTSYPNLKKPATTFFAMRFALVIAVLVLTVSIVNSQTSSSKTDRNKTVSGTQNQNTISSQNKTVVAPGKFGEHAPDINDPNFEAKKAEWIKNYPEEYKACQKSPSNTNTGSNAGTTTEIKRSNSDHPQKVAEHAPDLNDPDYDAKKAEWIQNYPQEYEQLLKNK